MPTRTIRWSDKVRAANDRFKDVAVAVAEGYGPIPCASGLQGGAMGIHYVNGEFLKDGVIDIAKPEAVMYEPTADGKMDLVAVEYIAFKGPAALEGHLFNFNGAAKPLRPRSSSTSCTSGPGSRIQPAQFADNNPDVTCDAAARRRPHLAHILWSRDASQDYCKFPAGQIKFSFAPCVAKIAAAIERRRIRGALGKLDDYMLKDMGIARSDIERISNRTYSPR